MVAVEAELQRRNAALALVNWLLVADTKNTVTGLSDPVIDYGARAELQTLNSLVPSVYDTIQLSYTANNLTTVVFKLAAATVSTLTLAYTGARLDSVVKT